MRRLIPVLVLTAFATPAFASADSLLDVYVKNSSGVPVASVQVAAIHFGTSGPDALLSRISTTDASGYARFSGGNRLAYGNDYEIFASSQGFLPSIRDQFNSPEHIHKWADGTYLSTPTVILSSYTKSDLGQILQSFQKASAPLVFGSVHGTDPNFSEPVAFAMTDSGGAAPNRSGLLRYDNVPYGPAAGYAADAFDSFKNKNASRVVGPALSAPGQVIDYSALADALDFDAGMPPMTIKSDVSQPPAGGSGLSVDGVVTDTDSVYSVPWVGINLRGSYVQYQSTMTDYRWANADQNGRFQFYGLMPGVTYYADVFNGCNMQINTCYQASASTAPAGGLGASPGVNDFYYPSTSTVLTHRIELQTAPSGNGMLPVYIVDSNGNPIRQAGVGIYPDFNGWETGGSCAAHVWVSSPGLTNATANATTGYALLTGLVSGNYRLNAWTPFGQSGEISPNNGPDGKPCWQSGNCQCDNNDDYRITLSTWVAGTPWAIWDSSGVKVGLSLSSITIVANVVSNNTGLVHGTLTFPRAVDLSADPISIAVSPNCSGGCAVPGNITFSTGSLTSAVLPYEVHVASGYSYWLNVNSNYWGVVRNGGGDNKVDLTATDAAVWDLKFAPAGRIVGKLYKPDGSVYRPPKSMMGGSASVSAEGDNSYGWTQVNEDGSYVIGGLLAGEYALRVSAWGGDFPYTTPLPAPKASVEANKDTYMDFHAVDGIAVRIDVATTSLTPISFIPCTPHAKDCPVEDYGAKLMPAGTVINEDFIRSVLFHQNGIARFDYSPDPVQHQNCENSQLYAPGFCVNRLPSPKAYDAYLYRQGGFDSANLDGVRPHFTVLGSSRNVIVDVAHSSSTMFWSGSTVAVRALDMNPPQSLRARGMATFAGTVTGQYLYRSQDFDAMGGNFENFMKYIPLMMLYDAGGNLVSAGMVIPPPACFGTLMTCNGVPNVTRDDCLNQAVAKNDFSLFSQIFATCGGMGYELRGVSTGTYSAVLTSPNYPPYQTSVSLLAAGSTVTLNIDLDSAVGTGGTLTGALVSTMSVTLSNAAVTIESEGYKERTFTSNSAGVYRAEGLPAGSYSVKVKAAGYVFTVGRADISAGATQTLNFTLKASGASISGTVYGQKVPFPQVQPGAQIVAYNDTQNVLDPSAELALYKTVTSSVGFYRLDGLEAGQTYKIFVKAPGKYILDQSTRTIVGERSGLDFTLLSKPLDIELFGHPVPPNYEFNIKNPNDFQTGHAWVHDVPFDMTGATSVDIYFQQLPNNELLLRIPASVLASQTADYTLHLEAVSKAGKTVTKEVVFGFNRKANATQAIDDALLGDDSVDSIGRKSNQAMLDASGGNPSAVSLPVGALIPVSSGAVPTCQFTNTDVNASTVAAIVGAIDGGTKTFASGVYQISMSSVNYTDKGFDITLAYDKTNASLGDLSLKHYDDTTKKWETVPGTQTIDPVKGTITVRRVRSLASVLGLKKGHPMLAVATASGYAPSAYRVQAAGGDTGFFSILKPSLIGQPYGGSTLKIYNFPNPFNLSLKTPTLVHKQGGQTDVNTFGTIIKIETPSNVGGHGVIRIYTVNGELVREIGVDLAGGTYFYTEWDGTNSRGAKVANGVYYGVLTAPGVKPKDATFKMAVIK